MSRHKLRYPDAPSTSSQVSYSLVALPAALAKAVNERDSGGGVLASLTIKGQPTDEAVLCTEDTTYNLRAVQSSNSILICEASTSADGARPNGKGKEVEVRTTLHQTLELELAIPKLERVGELLKGQEWDPEEEEEERKQVKRRKTRRYTREDILDLVPASDLQIEEALRERRILTIDTNCRPLSRRTLSTLLRNILNTLTMLEMKPEAIHSGDLADVLAKDDNIPPEVTSQLLDWFGTRDESGSWHLDTVAVVREIGKAVLSENKNKAVKLSDFTASWRSTVGEQFADICDLDRLKGLYLLTPAKGPQEATVMYFSASELPTDPASRFSELFSMKPKWRMDEIAPFLQDLAVDSKKRDALTLKFTRKFKGEDNQTYYTARGK